MTKTQELAKWRKRRAQMVRYRESGWSFGRIAKKYGISRQRVHQIMDSLNKSNGKGKNRPIDGTTAESSP